MNEALNGSEVEAPQVNPDQVESPVIENEQSEISPDQTPSTGNEENGVQKRINEITAQKYAEKRRADALEAELAQLRQGQQPNAPTQQTAPSELKAPELPQDLFDEDAMRQYHAQTAQYNQQVAQQQAQQVIAAQQQSQQQQAQQMEFQQKVNSYAERGLNDGLTIEQMQQSEQVLTQAGITPELGQFIMEDSNGAKIADYLAKNPAEMHEVLAMNPMAAAAKVATEIKAKALANKPKFSNAPDPVPSVGGAASPTGDAFMAANPQMTFE